MQFRDQLRAQKAAGERELYSKRTAEEERAALEAERIRLLQRKRRTAEEEKDWQKAEAIFGTLPELVRNAATKGLGAAILSDSLVSEQQEEGKRSRAVVFNKQQVYLTGWQVPFYEKCKEEAVPLTIVTEQANSGIKRMLGRKYHFLAVDMNHL